MKKNFPMTVSMSLQPVLIDGEWCQSENPVGSLTAVNPATKSQLPNQFPVSGKEDVERALHAAVKAASVLRIIPPDSIAHFLELYALNIEKRTDELVELAHLETGLPKEPRLQTVELPRTTNQLRLAAAAARERSWCLATIDSQNNIRSMYQPLGGPVIIFGPNNFPFAFNSIAGGDFAAAIASGNPVIARANPGHPGTTRLKRFYMRCRRNLLKIKAVHCLGRRCRKVLFKRFKSGSSTELRLLPVEKK
jgi:2,5-dioxopentanoate dehydrogenase